MVASIPDVTEWKQAVDRLRESHTLLPAANSVFATLRDATQAILQGRASEAAKPARPTRGEVRLETRQGALLLEVGDDGVGFDRGADFPGHLGPRSMGEPAVQLGGTLEVSSAPGQGTRIRATIPVTPGV